MRLAFLLLLGVLGCSPSNRDGNDAGDGCTGAGCQIVDCASRGMQPTSIKGTVFAPNGTLALYGVQVYVPSSEPGPLPTDLTCARCTDTLLGGALTSAISDDKGEFVLENAPSGSNVPLVIQVGKWRRQVTLPNVFECTENFVAAEQTRLPRTRAEGDLPRLAMVTGECDELECLMRKIGVDDSEFTPEGGSGAIHLFSANGSNRIGTQNLTTATSLWSDLEKLKRYDALFMSCECSQREDQKTQPMFDNVKAYADMGGRVFGTHFHNIWIDGKTGAGPTETPMPSAQWTRIAACSGADTGSITSVIDQQSNPKGVSFANWMLNVMGSTTHGTLIVQNAKQTCDSVDKTLAEQWTYSSGSRKPQTFQFTTPIEQPADQRCGKVVFSDMHVSGEGTMPSIPFPGSCEPGPMTAQEKALAFMLFDIASCVGQIN